MFAFIYKIKLVSNLVGLFEQSMKILNISKRIYNMPLEKNFFEGQKNSNMQSPKIEEFKTT